MDTNWIPKEKSLQSLNPPIPTEINTYSFQIARVMLDVRFIVQGYTGDVLMLHTLLSWLILDVAM